MGWWLSHGEYSAVINLRKLCPSNFLGCSNCRLLAGSFRRRRRRIEGLSAGDAVCGLAGCGILCNGNGGPTEDESKFVCQGLEIEFIAFLEVSNLFLVFV